MSTLTPLVVAPDVAHDIVADIVEGLGMSAAALGEAQHTWTIVAVPTAP